MTPEPLYRRRREFHESGRDHWRGFTAQSLGRRRRLRSRSVITRKMPFRWTNRSPQKTTPPAIITFTSLVLVKKIPKRNSRRFQTDDWTIEVSGECEKPGTYGLEDLMKTPTRSKNAFTAYAAVEAWSMVIPWLGVPLGSILGNFQPTSKARYVAFKTLHDPVRMPGQQRSVLNWPYREGLTIAEAMNPLTILSVGMYGKTMPNQKRRTGSAGCAMEIRIQKHPIHRRHRVSEVQR